MIALLRSRVVLDIHAKGVTLHGRPPASTKPAAPVVDAPIPLRPIEAPPVPVVDESLAKWTIDVDMKISDGRELWVDAVRYAGWLTTELECSLLHAVHDASHALQSLVVEARSALQPVQFVAIVRPARGVMTRSLAKCHSGLGESTPDCAFPCWLSNCSWWPNKQTRS